MLIDMMVWPVHKILYHEKLRQGVKESAVWTVSFHRRHYNWMNYTNKQLLFTFVHPTQLNVLFFRLMSPVSSSCMPLLCIILKKFEYLLQKSWTWLMWIIILLSLSLISLEKCGFIRHLPVGGAGFVFLSCILSMLTTIFMC